MKTYTLKEFKQVHNKLTLPFNETWNYNCTCTCTCISPEFMGKFKNVKGTYAFEDCLNCHGEGIMPIPWSDLCND